MSSFDPSDPFDNGQPWQNVHSTQPVWPALDHESAPVSTFAEQTTSRTPAPATVAAPAAAAPGTHSIADTVTSFFHRTPSPAPPAAATPSTASEAASGSSSNPIPASASTQTQNTTQPSKAKMAAKNEEEPPSYESSVIRDTNTPLQIHDNYDHLRGPPGQRGVDIKTRIPLDSTPAEHIQSGSTSGSNAQSGQGAGGSGSQPSRQYGATSQTSSTSPSRLQGQTSHGQDDDDAQHARDTDRLLGPNSTAAHPTPATRPEGNNEEEPKTHWSVVGDGKAWGSFFYIIFVIIPLSLIFFIWSMATLIISAVSMIFPPIGYFVVIATVTSWRALGRLDLLLSRSLVSKDVRDRHPYLTFDIFVKPGSEECEHHGIHAASSPSHSSDNNNSNNDTYTTAEGEVRQRRRKPRNVFDKSATHLSASFSNKHTLKTLSYLLIWKLVLAVPVFVVVVVFGILTIPLIFCLLPSLLIISRTFMHWQFRWAILWLAERHKPIALP
ncbi:hypothetical protein FBU30_003074 [Linnemannia zychae]|nr:hypothetical protein FBU30_003074 [Linnemannia zychae]